MHVKALASQPDSLATTHTSRVAGVAFSFCGEHLLSVDEGGEFCVTSFRRTPDGKLRIYRRQKLSLGTTSPVSSLALVPDPSGSVAFGMLGSHVAWVFLAASADSSSRDLPHHDRRKQQYGVKLVGHSL